MVNYGEAFKLPFTNWKTFGILCLIAAFGGTGGFIDKDIFELLGIQLSWASFSWILPVVLVSAFFGLLLMGYQLRVARNAVRGNNSMPSFDDIGALLRQGLKYWAATLVYLIPFVIVILAITSLVMLRGRAVAGGILMLLLLIIIGIFWMGYIFPVLVANFAYQGRFLAFFEVKKAFRIAFNARYFIPWLAVIGYSIGVYMPALILGVIIGLVALVSPLVILASIPFDAVATVIIGVTAMNIYGQAYHDIVSAKPAVATVAAKRKK